MLMALIPNKYRQIYKEPITDNINGNVNLINNAKQVLDSDLSPVLVENGKWTKLSGTYVMPVGHDRLRNKRFIYVARLKFNRTAVVHRHIENAVRDY